MSDRDPSTVFVTLLKIEEKQTNWGSYKRLVIKQEYGFWMSIYRGTIFKDCPGYNLDLQSGDKLKLKVN